MAANNREARRKRIMERGSDRLALITGRIQTLPQSTSTEPLDFDLGSALPTSRPAASHQIASVSHDDKGIVSDTVSSKQASISDPGQSDAYDVRRNLGSAVHESEGSDQISNPPNLDFIDKATLSSSSVTPTFEGGGNETIPNRSTDASQTLGFISFSLTQLSSAVTASQMTRLLCSVIVAVVVVLAHIGFPLSGSKIVKSTIISRPFYLILLTDITIVIARLLSKKQADTVRPAKRDNDSMQADSNDWATLVGRTLEAGLVMRSLADAVFMDFGVYTVIVVCGLSFVQLRILFQ